jgi:uncharacterized protein (DUF1800 family)
MAERSVRDDVAHLVRRAAFGAPPEAIDDLADLGYEGAVEALCDVEGPDPAAEAVVAPTFQTAAYLEGRRGDEAARREAARIAREERRALPLWWLQRMVAADRPLREKLTFHWHGHFATSLEKVKVAEFLFVQHDTLHRLGTGRFDALVHAVARDPAMLVWLDGVESTAGAPNENFARELFELFTLGHGSGHGDQPYTEADVADAARALTGWVIDRGTRTGVLDPRRHDPGAKAVLGTTGALGLDEVVAAATTHPACALHVVSRLWSRFARPGGADDPVVLDLAASFAADLDIAALIRRVFLHAEFRAPATRTALVRTPVELVVGLARTLGFPVSERSLPALNALGQVPFVPPDVSGWPANEAWLSTASALVRLRIAEAIASATSESTLAEVDRAGPSGRPAALARLLGLPAWGGATTAALTGAPDATTALTLAIVAPEHLVS